MMVGLSCQWEWEVYVGKPCDEYGAIKSDEDIDLIAKSFADQVVWLRNHPSIFVWVFGSDMLPRPKLEKRYLNDLETNDPTRPTLSSCQLKTSTITGSTGVKMLGPYDYVTPNYWYSDTKNGGAYGFNTETGPGPQIPTIETLKKMFPEDKLWPINYLWDYHSGRHEFNTIGKYMNAMNNRYGTSTNIEAFLLKAQLSNYEAIRPMFEAFAVNKANAGGIVQWMLNAPWPKLFWQLYDYYLTPTAAFFGTQNALKPLHLVYNYQDKSIYAVNDYYNTQQNLTAEIKVFNINSQEIFAKSIKLSIDANSSKTIMPLPEEIAYTVVYFVDF
jgi:exo-1,4-beta-D-glucosaminidase